MDSVSSVTTVAPDSVCKALTMSVICFEVDLHPGSVDYFRKTPSIFLLHVNA